MIDKIKQLLEAEMEKQQIPSLAIGVVRGEEPLLLKGCGLANLEHAIPATANTVYEIASITKLFTTTAVFMLLQEGQLALDDPIATHLPNLPAAWQPITIRHILMHQSGIPSYTETAAYWKTTRLDISKEEILALVTNQPLNFLPGQKHGYDNTGFYLLGLLIEAVSGQPYDQFLQERIFAPLGMSNTRANDPYAIVPNRAAGYGVENGRFKNAEYYSPSGTYSAGMLLSSVSDLAKWAATLHTSRLLHPKSQQLMWTAHKSASNNEGKFQFTVGLGWFLVNYKGHQFVGHNGSIMGFASAFVHFIDAQLSLIILCNSDAVSNPHDIAIQVASYFE